MARDIIATKSFRTIVGVMDQNAPLQPGISLLGTNDSSRYYGFFMFFNGEPEKAVFATEYLKKKFAPYADVFQRGDLSKPQTFMKEALAALLREMSTAGMGMGDNESFAVALVKEGVVVLGRLNNCPVFLLRDRKFRQIFMPGKGGGQRLEVEAYFLADGDKIFICSEQMVKRLTKLELRNILATETDPDLACSKIAMLAGRYEEITEPKLILISFHRKHESNKALFSKRNLAVFVGTAVLILLLIFWREAADVMGRIQIKWPSRKGQTTASDKTLPGKQPLYQYEKIYDNLAVPYDIAVDPKGVLYIVDDKETKVIRYDPNGNQVTLIGNDLNLGFPTGVEIEGDKLYVTDFANKSSALYIIKTDGQVVTKITSVSDPKVGDLKQPKAVAIDPNGEVWVADRGNNRLLQFDLSGGFQKAISLKPQFKGPNGLAFGPGPAYDIYVTLRDSNMVIRVTRDGKQNKLDVYPADNDPSPFAFNQPAGVAVDSNNFLYVADKENSRIIVADPVGKVIAKLDKTKFGDFDEYKPFGLKISPDGKYLYVVGSTHTSYDDTCNASKCKGKIWRIRI